MSRDIVRRALARVETYRPFERDSGWWFVNPKGVEEGPYESEWAARWGEDWWHA